MAGAIFSKVFIGFLKKNIYIYMFFGGTVNEMFSSLGAELRSKSGAKNGNSVWPPFKLTATLTHVNTFKGFGSMWVYFEHQLFTDLARNAAPIKVLFFWVLRGDAVLKCSRSSPKCFGMQ